MPSSRPVPLTTLPVLAVLIQALSGCGGGAGCPTAKCPAGADSAWETQLDQKKELVLDPKRDITIKRDVHSIVVAADTDKMASAFHEVMRDTKRHYGLIRVDRKQANIGKPFQVGERFQGRYQIDDALLKNLPSWEKKIFGDLAQDPGIRTVICNIENQSSSDYGIIAQLDLSPKDGQDYVLSYHYLDGSPIAGSSTFIISKVSPGVSKVTQIFEYQEQTHVFALFFSSGGLKLHNQVVYSQAAQAAELLGVKVVSSDIPELYREP
jgi:hypothetical protein